MGGVGRFSQAKPSAVLEFTGMADCFSRTLTTGVDQGAAFTGSAGDDIFIADNSTAAIVTSVADNINGGSGNDTLTIYGFDNATDGTPQISNIETIVVSNSVATTAISLVNATGLSSVVVKDAAGATTTTVGNGVSVTLLSNDADTAQVVNYGSTATSANLVLNDVVTTTTVDVEAQGALVTVLNISTTGVASTVGQLEVDAAMATVNITGDKDLTITDAVEDAVNTINAVNFTGKLSLSVVNPTDAGAVSGVDGVDVTINTGSGNDTVTATTPDATDEIAINTGAGDDTVVIDATKALELATSSTKGDSIDGGTGTDTLSVAAALGADLTGIVSGFETLKITSLLTMDMSANKLGITNFVIDADTTLSNLGATTTATIGNTGVDLTATILTLGTADTLTVTLESNTTTGSDIIANSHDVINIVSSKTSSDASTVVNELENLSSATSAAALNVSGTQALVIQSMALKAAASVTNTSTGALTSTFSTSLGSYSGSAAADTLSLVAGNLAQGKTFNGGAGTDSLTVSATASQDMGILALTGFETLNFTTSGANAVDLRNVTDLTTLNIAAATAGTDTLTISRIGADTTLKIGAATTAIVTTVNSGTAQKVAVSANVTSTALTLDSGTTSLTLTFDNGDATTAETMGTITTLTGTSLTTITVLGNDDANLGTIDAASVNTINASASKGNLTVTGTSTATSITGSAVGDTITGGSGVDTINGGAGADTLTTGGGLDILTGGDTTALDTFTISGAAAGTATSQITITDFKTAANNTANSAVIADTLVLKDAGNITGTGVVAGAATNLVGAASLAAALDLLAAGNGGVNAAITFGVYGGDTYVVIDNTAGATLAATDAVIKLTGVTTMVAADMSYAA